MCLTWFRHDTQVLLATKSLLDFKSTKTKGENILALAA